MFENKNSNYGMDQNPTIIETEEKVNKSIEYSTSDASDCQVKDQFLESSIVGTVDSSTENDSENIKTLLETIIDVSTDIQTVESLEDQFLEITKGWENCWA